MVFFMFICFPAALRKINGYPRAWRGSRRQTYESLPPGGYIPNENTGLVNDNILLKTRLPSQIYAETKLQAR